MIVFDRPKSQSSTIVALQCHCFVDGTVQSHSSLSLMSYILSCIYNTIQVYFIDKNVLYSL